MKCKKCGAELQEGNKFCQQCGALIDNAPAEPTNEEDRQLMLAYIGGNDPEGFANKMFKRKYLNIPAAIFTLHYYVYRKMYLEGVLVMLGSIVASGIIGGIIGALTNNTNISGALGSIITIVMFGSLFFPLYQKKMYKALEKIRWENGRASTQVLMVAAQKAGGTSVHSVVMLISFVSIVISKTISIFQNSIIMSVSAKRPDLSAVIISMMRAINISAVIFYIAFVVTCVLSIMKYMKDRKECLAATVKEPSATKPIFAGFMILIATILVLLPAAPATSSVSYTSSEGDTVTVEQTIESDDATISEKVKIKADEAKPEETAAPAEDSTSSAEAANAEPSDDGFALHMTGGETITLPKIKGMSVITTDSSVAYNTDYTANGENLSVFYSDAYIETGDEDSVKELFSYAEKMSEIKDYKTTMLYTTAGNKMYVQSYRYDSGLSYVNVVEDIGTDTLLSIKITDYDGTHDVSELVRRFAVTRN